MYMQSNKKAPEYDNVDARLIKNLVKHFPT